MIRAHSFPLVASSTYFAATMAEKRWKEGVERVLDVTLSGGQALEDFKLLLQGAYTRSFVRSEEEGPHFAGPPEDAEEALTRRLVKADAYGFEGAVGACARALARLTYRFFSFTDAAEAFTTIPEPLLSQPSLRTFVRRLGVILAKGPAGKPSTPHQHYPPGPPDPVPRPAVSEAARAPPPAPARRRRGGR